MKKIVALIGLLAVVLTFGGCGVNHKDPTGVVKSMVTALEKGKQRQVLNCYGMKKGKDEATDNEVASNIKYFKAHNSKGIEILDCDVIKEYKKYSYIYISYELKLADKKTYPCIATYMVKKADKKYYVIPTKDITDEMSAEAEEAYKTFMTSNTYKNYTKAYEKFIRANPKYEEKIAKELKS